jgi:hypothetical protein
VFANSLVLRLPKCRVPAGSQAGYATLRIVNSDGKVYMKIFVTKIKITSVVLTSTPTGLLETFTVCTCATAWHRRCWATLRVGFLQRGFMSHPL